MRFDLSGFNIVPRASPLASGFGRPNREAMHGRSPGNEVDLDLDRVNWVLVGDSKMDTTSQTII